MSSPKGPFRLVTVNTAPDRARRLVGQVIEVLKDRYTIEHLANCETIDQVTPIVSKVKPNILFCASMWTPEQAEEIQSTARLIVPDIITYAIPEGLQVEKGPDAVVEHLIDMLPRLLG